MIRSGSTALLGNPLLRLCSSESLNAFAQNAVHNNCHKKHLWNAYLQRSMTTLRRPGNEPKGIPPHAWFLLTIPAATFALGCWQVKRKAWKEDLIEHMHRRIHRNPIPLPLTMEEIDKLDYCPVTLTGTFDHSKELYLGPRSQINVENHKGGEGGGIFSTSKAGYNVITPFKPNDRDYYILINRGWVPSDRKNPAHRAEGQISGEVTLNGIIRLPEKREPFMMKNSPEQNHWVYRDVDKMAEVAGTAPIFIDAAEDSWIPGGPIGGQTNLSIRNEHMQYIITWFSLCAVTSYMWYNQFMASTNLRGRLR
ncbi:Surfeit locus protein 1 [Frankliniella fusca]|uniref:SURF1-like protein n=1 Tax=Frankliniella fusca TaxID=407009 RepID=A0AAE1HNN9_9NEOP|nr:Surfeit locus protein 1 [Frankliniella fusca]